MGKNKRKRKEKVNKYSIKENLKLVLHEYVADLKTTSYDTQNDEYLCADTTAQPVYNFDEYVQDALREDPQPASPDAIVIGNKKLYFVEFKNQLPSNIDKKRIKNKFVAGTRILQDILKDIKVKDCEMIFCVVHKTSRHAQTRPRSFGANHLYDSSLRSLLQKWNANLDNFYGTIVVDNVDFYKETHPQLKC